MQSKYKVGLLRLNLLLAALLPALMAPASTSLTEALLLWLAAGWLAVSALLVEFGHRRPVLVPWQLLPSLLLAALLWLAPERFAPWLWVWAALAMLPQPGWLTALQLLLAALSWWALADRLPQEQVLLGGLLLAVLMPLAMLRARAFEPLSHARRRTRLIPGLRLWPHSQLEQDMNLERARSSRDRVHCELLLLRTSRRRLWPLAERLCRLTRSFEPCYRLDGQTLAALLLAPDPAQAERRRAALLAELPELKAMRATPLHEVASLQAERRALDEEQP